MVSGSNTATAMSSEIHSDQPTLIGSHDIEREAPGPAPAVFDHHDDWFGGRKDLAPVLGRRHIFMMSISGTMGINLFLTSSQILRQSGSTGVIVAYAIVGLVAAAVMSCIAEMLSLIPEAGALTLFPSRFVDSSLGFAVGICYWFQYSTVVTSLIAMTARLSLWWPTEVVDIGMGWRIFLFLLVLILINIFGVKAYGEVEHLFGWLKIVLVVGLTILMLTISVGANKDHKYYGVEYWKGNYTVPSSFDGYPSRSGGAGKLIAVCISSIQAVDGYVGVEIVAVCAGEAKYPRRDVPFVAQSVFMVVIGLYISSIMSMSLVVPWTNDSLAETFSIDHSQGSSSAFIIATKNAGYRVLPDLVNAGFMFAAWTTANTALYVASRTLYGMCFGLDRNHSRLFWPLGRTRKGNGAPVMAILVSCIFAPLAWLQFFPKTSSPILQFFSTMEGTAALITWGSQCLAFLRFYFGLKYSMYSRDSSSYPFRSRFQPFTAIFGLVCCFLLVVCRGVHDKPIAIIAAYSWPALFISIYAAHKFTYGTKMVPLRGLDYNSLRSDNDREPDPSGHWRQRNFLCFGSRR